jgi:branched-chain amino acid transport system ATP-binding protein
MSALLCLRGVKAYYGNIIALRGVDVDVREGEIVTLIGANGAGKSTLMMTIFGRPRAREGEILFSGRDITALPTHQIARLSIAQSPEGRRIFSRMTVMENLQMGALMTGGGIAADLDRVLALFPRLRERLHQRGGTLSGGEQQMLAIARALMTNPSLLLLDEPLEGLAPIVVEELAAAIRRMTAEGTCAFILIEQHADIALSLTENALLLERGRIVHSGPSAALLADNATLDRYIGLKLAEA